MSDAKEDAASIVDPLSLYDVAMATDRVLKIKRALEAAGFTVKVETKINVDISLEILDLRPGPRKKGK